MAGKKDKKGDSQKGKPAAALGPVGCAAKGCKAKESRLGFCSEHFDHFKFGLIKKDGSPAPDYDKKFKHYAAMLEKRQAA